MAKGFTASNTRASKQSARNAGKPGTSIDAGSKSAPGTMNNSKSIKQKGNHTKTESTIASNAPKDNET